MAQSRFQAQRLPTKRPVERALRGSERREPRPAVQRLHRVPSKKRLEISSTSFPAAAALLPLLPSGQGCGGTRLVVVSSSHRPASPADAAALHGNAMGMRQSEFPVRSYARSIRILTLNHRELEQALAARCGYQIWSSSHQHPLFLSVSCSYSHEYKKVRSRASIPVPYFDLARCRPSPPRCMPLEAWSKSI